MTVYSDIPEVNDLYVKLEQCDQALQMVNDQTGTLKQFSVGLLQAPTAPGPPVITLPMPAPITIVLPNPASASTMTIIHDQLVTYHDDLVTQLTNLGVTATPTRMEG
jgi:hypothetical protein